MILDETITRSRYALLTLALALPLSLVAALAVPAAFADDSPIQHLEDGSVIVDGLFFDSMTDYHTSDDFRANGRRCSAEDPQFLQQLVFPSDAAADCSFSSTTIRSEYAPANGPLYRIPVVFHVIQRTDGTGSLTVAQIQSQIEILNEDFRALGGTPGSPGIDTGIEFYLATEDPNGNPTDGINFVTNNAYFTDPGPGAFNDMKQALNWDTTRYLNAYSNDASGSLGYATFPQQDAGSVNDGIVLLWSSVGRNNPNGGIYNQGRTATHEVGHYLGIFHTFQSGCGSSGAPYTTGDLIADTNQQSSANFNCPTGASSCGSSDPIRNYMNYTQDTCMNRFSAEQANRMRCSVSSYRDTLVGGGNPPPPTGGELQNGVPRTGLSGAQGNEQFFTLEVPAGASNLSFQISGGTGDADLYVRFGAQPTTSTWDCRPYLNGNNETCDISPVQTGTYHVMLRAFTTFSGVSLVGSYTESGPACSTLVNFESGAAGWTNSSSSTCSTGSFVVGTPTEIVNSSVTTQVGGDHTSGSGDAFFSATNSSAGSNDVDGGNCIVLSPTYSVPVASDVSVWYFHGQRDTGDDGNDFFRLEISTDGGSTWSTLRSIGDTQTNAAWTEATTTVSAGASVRFRVQVSDGSGPGDLIEAGVDDISICPSK